jgi:hypothetical protein
VGGRDLPALPLGRRSLLPPLLLSFFLPPLLFFLPSLLLLVAGIGGLVQTLVPRAVVRAWTEALYRNAGEAEPREWVLFAARAEGAVHVLGALVGLFRVATAADDDPVDGIAAGGDAIRE